MLARADDEPPAGSGAVTGLGERRRAAPREPLDDFAGGEDGATTASMPRRRVVR